MGISDGTRANISQMFDFKNDGIVPEGMYGGWQTSGSMRVCYLAFNLWNGYVDENNKEMSTPDNLFCCGYAPYWRESN